MAAADCAGGGAWDAIWFCGGDFALLCRGRALAGKILWGDGQSLWDEGSRWWSRGRWRGFCSAAATRYEPAVREFLGDGRGAWSECLAGCGSGVARGWGRCLCGAADGFLGWERERGAVASRFFCARLSATLCGRIAAGNAVERLNTLYLPILQTEAGVGRAASAGRWRAAIADLLVLSSGMGVSADRVSEMRGRGSCEAPGVYGGRVEACTGGMLR